MVFVGADYGFEALGTSVTKCVRACARERLQTNILRCIKRLFRMGSRYFCSHAERRDWVTALFSSSLGLFRPFLILIYLKRQQNYLWSQVRCGCDPAQVVFVAGAVTNIHKNTGIKFRLMAVTALACVYLIIVCVVPR